MKNIRIIIVLVVFPFFCIIGQNQQSLPEDRPIIPPSPRAAAFHIYGDYPVNYNTGIADISIPLYTVKMEGIEVPITLRYHHAGVKFYECRYGVDYRCGRIGVTNNYGETRQAGSYV